MSFTPDHLHTTDADAGKPFAIVRAGAAMAACVASAMWAFVALIDAGGWDAQKPYAIYAGLVCGGAAIVALIPVWLLSRKSVQGAAMGFMAGILVRMALCGFAVVWGGRMEGVDRMSWSMWIAGWYMLVLVIEVGLVGRYIARAKLAGVTTNQNSGASPSQGEELRAS